jgi:hypothetical protein
VQDITKAESLFVNEISSFLNAKIIAGILLIIQRERSDTGRRECYAGDKCMDDVVP